MTYAARADLSTVNTPSAPTAWNTRDSSEDEPEDELAGEDSSGASHSARIRRRRSTRCGPPSGSSSPPTSRSAARPTAETARHHTAAHAIHRASADPSSTSATTRRNASRGKSPMTSLAFTAISHTPWITSSWNAPSFVSMATSAFSTSRSRRMARAASGGSGCDADISVHDASSARGTRAGGARAACVSESERRGS